MLNKRNIEESLMRIKAPWVKIHAAAWHLLAQAEKKAGGRLDARAAELIFGPAVAESLIRFNGQAVAKMMPSPKDIGDAYRSLGGKETELQILERIEPADFLAAKFAEISHDKNVAVSARIPATAQVICILAHTLEPVARQEFQACFVWDESRRAGVFNDDELAKWDESEFQLGMGMVSSIWHAKQAVPDLTPAEFATAMLRKYGVPIQVGQTEVFACHWCGTGPCSCGGGKSPARNVTYEEAARNLHRGPMDTQMGMYFPYAWANIARGGAGYGPFRALIETAAEKGSLLLDDGTPGHLERTLGPFLMTRQRHFAEIVERFGRNNEKGRKALVSELADAVHWQFLYGPGLLDHAAGLRIALFRIAHYCGDETIGMMLSE